MKGYGDKIETDMEEERLIALMSSIIECTDSIIGNITDIENIIKNSNISDFASVDESAESKGIYAVTGCIPEVWGVIFHSHFRIMEEQLDQIINNTARNGFDTLNTILALVGTYTSIKAYKKPNNFDGNDNDGGDDGGSGGFFSWLTDPENRDTIVGTIGSIGIASRIVKDDEVTDVPVVGSVPVGDTEPVVMGVPFSVFVDKMGTGNVNVDYYVANRGSHFSEDLKVAGSWFKDKSSELWQDYLDKYSMEQNNSDGVTGASGFFRKGSVERTKFNEARKEAERLVLGEYLNSFQKYPIELSPLWRILSAYTSAMANYVDFGGARRSRYIDWSGGDEETESKRGLKIFSGAGLWPALQGLLLPLMLNAEKNTLPGSESITGYYDVASANALGNGNIYSNSQNDLRDDNSKNMLNQIATQNNNSNVNNNPINYNTYNIQVKNEVDLDNLLRDIKALAETEVASVMDYSGMRG